MRMNFKAIGLVCCVVFLWVGMIVWMSVDGSNAEAADIDLRVGSTSALGWQGKPISVQRITIRYEDNPTTVGQDIRAFHIPANTLVLGVAAKVDAAAGATGTVDVGDSGSATRYHSNVNLKNVGASWSKTSTGLDKAYFYTDADYITVNSDHITTGGVLSLSMLAIQP